MWSFSPIVSQALYFPFLFCGRIFILSRILSLDFPQRPQLLACFCFASIRLLGALSPRLSRSVGAVFEPSLGSSHLLRFFWSLSDAAPIHVQFLEGLISSSFLLPDPGFRSCDLRAV